MTSDYDENTVTAKSVAMCVLFTASLTVGTLPVFLSKLFNWNSDSKNNKYVRMLLCAGGGVLLCTTFLHLLPEVSDRLDELNFVPKDEIHYAELLMCVGFFTMYLVEECVHAYIHHRQKAIVALARSLSIRRGDLAEEKAPSTIENAPKLGEESTINICVEDLKKSNNDHNHKHSHNGVGHSHMMYEVEDNVVKTLRGLLVVLALSVHELFEGLAVGLESSSKNVWYMFGAVSAHKLIIAFCIGVELVTSGMKTCLVVVYVFTFAVVSPMGIGAGIMLSKNGSGTTTLPSVLLQGLASGTLLYVVFFEILSSDRKSGLRQFFAVLFGFLVMLGITYLE